MTLLTLLLALVAQPSQRGAELQLNLVATAPPPERPDHRHVGEGCGGAVGSSTHGPVTKPLKVTLADTDRLAYTVGDTMSFNVVLENTGAAPMMLGISRDPEVAPKSMQPCRVVPPGVHFRVALVAMTPKGPGAVVAVGVGFYGSADVPGTTVVLQPGERARVQLPATILAGQSTDALLAANPQPLQIKAFVMIERNTSLTVYSENVLEIELPAIRSPARGPARLRAQL